MRLYDKLPHFVYLNNEKYFDQRTGNPIWPGQNGGAKKDGYVDGEGKEDIVKAGVE